MKPPPPEVQTVFDKTPEPARTGLLTLRDLILRLAEETGAEPLEETLKWGQPAYRAARGTTLRLGQPKTGGTFALYAHCSTPLIAEFRDMTGGAFTTEGNRAVLFADPDEIDQTALAPLITRALHWHKKDRK